MKIGLVTPSWPGDRNANGITTTVYFLTQGLEALGHEVTIIAVSQTDAGDPRCIPIPPGRPMRLGERIARKLGSGEPLQITFAERIAAAVQTAMRTRGIEVLVMEETQGWAGIVQAMVPIPVIITLHGPWFIQIALQSEPVTADDRHRERREAKACRTCAGITSPSRDVLDKTRAQVPGMVALNAIIPNPIPLKPAVDYDQLDDRQRKSILFVGRHEYRKGADILLQSFEGLIRQGTDAYLTFIGPDSGMVQPDGSSVSMPRALSRLDAETQARITNLGPQSKDEIDIQRQRHFMTVVASRHENFPYVLLEALASGSAAVSSAAGGPAEIVRDGETGLLVPAQDPEAMTRACRRLLDDPALAASLGQAARRDVAKRFAPERIAADLVAFCERVIRKGRS
jgi:glycosyltransferase involved in cell wall biosynthesis